MSISVTCTQCGKQYRVAENLLGRRAKCRQCGATLDVRSPESLQASDPLLADLPQPGEPPANSVAATGDLGGPAESGGRKLTSGTTAGPTDRHLRMGAAIAIPVAVLGMTAALFGLRPNELTYGAVIVVGLGPFAIFFGIAGLISPNVLRAATKHGKSLPIRYKVIAVAVGLAALACSLPLALRLISR